MRIIAELMRGCLKQVVGGSSAGRVMEYVLGKKKDAVLEYISECWDLIRNLII